MMHTYRLVGIVTWLLTALCSIHVGLVGLGIDVLASDFVMNNLANFVRPLQYVFGIAGVVSLLMLFMSLSKGGCSCK